MLKINIKENSIYLNESQSLIGIIFFSVGEYCFPSDDWYDFVVVLIGWLGKIAVDLYSCKSEEVQMSFMEGPFKIVLTLDNKNLCKISFIEGEKLADDQEIIHRMVMVPFPVLIDEIMNSCQTVIQVIKKKNFEYIKDYEELVSAYLLIQNLAQDLRQL